MNAPRLAPIACLAAWGIFLVGCGGTPRGPKVTGQVLLDGKALSEARVVFDGKGGGATRTNSEGKFEFGGTGPTVQPGSYLVFITKYVDKKGNVPDTEDYEQLEASGMGKNIVPRLYSDPEVAPLRADIKAGDNELKPFELKSK